MGISFVIPVHGEDIEPSIRALERSYLELSPHEREGVEVLLVDDAGPALHLPETRLPLQVLRQPANLGVAAARNRGIKEARHEHFVCLDADVIVGQEFLRGALGEASRGLSAPVVQGWIDGMEEEPLFARYLALTNVADALSYCGEAPLFSSGCFLSSRSFFERIGYFDERFTGSGGEEFEILSRFPPGAVALSEALRARHRYEGAVARLRKVWRRSRNYVSVAARNPAFPFRLKVIGALRLGAALLFFLSFPLALVFPMAGLALAAGALGLALLSDGGIYARIFWHRSGARLLLCAPFFLVLEYGAAGLGSALHGLRGRFRAG